MASFVSALKREIEYRQDFFKKGDKPATLYLGGGTPSFLPIDLLKSIVDSVLEAFSFVPEEFTIEVNPENINAAYVRELKSLGVNRISMGIQSFNDANLHWMNRRYNSQEAIEAFKVLRDCGMSNISLDLIFGYDGLTMDQWQRDVDRIIELHPEHISAYQMSIEEESALFDIMYGGGYSEMDDEESAAQYASLQKSLARAGYNQYEVSNFAVEGKESLHNSSYWKRVPYLGLGPSAHSFSGNRRSWNYAWLDKYIESLSVPKITGDFFAFETLSDNDIFNEQLMLGLRQSAGLDLSIPDKKRLESIMPKIEKLIDSEELIKENNFLRVPTEKLFVSDHIIGKLFI